MYWLNYPSQLFGNFHNVNKLFTELNDWFENQSRPVYNACAFPKLNAWTNSDGAVVTAELPGVDPNSIELSTYGSNLTIAGEIPVREKGENDVSHRGERSTGKFQRELALPFQVDSENVIAEYKHGILKVTLRRTEEDRPQKITVKAA